MKPIISLVIFFVSVTSYGQEVDSLTFKKEELLNKKVDMNDSIRVIDELIEIIDHRLIYLNRSRDSSLNKKFKVTMGKSSYMMSKPSGGKKIVLKVGQELKLLDFLDPKVKVLANEKVGYMWPVDLPNRDLVHEFISVIKGSSSNKEKKYYHQSSYQPKSSKRYIRGPRGGCYYINSKGNKQYVDRSLCN